MATETLPTPALIEHRPTSQESPRYHAFDCVRATAMLLGVFYHWQFVSGGMGMATGPKGSVDHWLHSFRMALFFLISGFFANMMLGKYGLLKYLRRRWWRIGAPLLAAIIGFAAFRFAQDYFPWAAAPIPGMGGTGAMGGFGTPGMGGGGMMPNFGMPPAGMAGGGNPAGAGVMPTNPFGGPGGVGYGMAPGGMGGMGGMGFPGYPTTAAATGPARGGATTMPAMPEGRSLFGGQGPKHPWADAIFKKLRIYGQRSDGQLVWLTADRFELQHLWFLWYLLVFCTVAPLVTMPAGAIFKGKAGAIFDRVGKTLLGWDLMPAVLALLSLPALLHAKGEGWALTNPLGFSGVFPDVFAQYFKDIPFYGVYFLFGWWFFRLRDGLDRLAKPWLFNLTLGIVAFAVSQGLYDKYHPMPTMGMMGFGFPMGGGAATRPVAAVPGYMETLAMGIYAMGAAYSGFGLLGLFQKYLNRATKLGKYFTDTMLWVYLVQLAIIPYLAEWVDYTNTSWWEATLGGVVLVTAVALVLFEVLVRPTPLVYIFGPASVGKRRAAAGSNGA